MPSLYYALNRLIRPQTLEWRKILNWELFVDGEFAFEKYNIRMALCEDFASTFVHPRRTPSRCGMVDKEEYLVSFYLKGEPIEGHRLEDHPQRIEDVGEDNAPVTFPLGP